MPVYVRMQDRTTNEEVLLKVRGTYDVELLSSDGINVNKYFNRVYATELSNEQKANAIQVDNKWRFIEDYDFGGEVMTCLVCQTKVLHVDGNCIRCNERTYQLHIWVKPVHKHYSTNAFTAVTDYDFKYEKSKFAYNPLIAECDTPESLLGVIEQSRNRSLTHSVHAMTTCKVMDDTRVRGMITDIGLKDLNVYELRWYYVRDEGGLLHHIETTLPPHWY